MLMKLFLLLAFTVIVSALPQWRQWRYRKGDSGTTGESVGEHTAVESGSKVNLGEGESEAESEGSAFAKGLGDSETTLESFGQLGDLEGTAGGGADAVGEETSAESQSKVSVLGRGFGSRARARNRAKARSRGGRRKSAIDTESGAGFTGSSDVFGAAGGQATGDETEVSGANEADSTLGGVSRVKSGVRGRSRSRGGQQAGSVDLGVFAGADGTEAEGDVLAIGNVEAVGKSQAESLVNENGEGSAVVENVAGSRGYRGRSGSRAGSATRVGGIETSATGEGRGSGVHTETSGSARSVQSSYGASGRAEGLSSSSSNNGEGSFAESSATFKVSRTGGE